MRKTELIKYSVDPNHRVSKLLSDNQCQAIVYHDYFAIRGGGERLVLQLCRTLNACLVCGFKNIDSFNLKDYNIKNRSLVSNSFLSRYRGFKTIIFSILFWVESKNACKVNIRIFSGIVSVFAAPSKRVSGVNIYYCHTPPRFLYDMNEYYFKHKISVYYIFSNLYKFFYQRAIGRMHLIIANSLNTQKRIYYYLGKNSLVIYPPIDTQKFTWLGQGDYYLSTARLEPLKRVDLIIQAFLKIPEKQLIILSGGSEIQKLKKLALNASNILILGWVSDEQMADYIGSAIATIYLAHNEDFGMSPLESMAAGKPVIGVAEGGMIETIIDKKSGLLLPSNFTLDELIAAIKFMSPAQALSMKGACEDQATNFSIERFNHEISKVVNHFGSKVE